MTKERAEKIIASLNMHRGLKIIAEEKSAKWLMRSNDHAEKEMALHAELTEAGYEIERMTEINAFKLKEDSHVKV